MIQPSEMHGGAQRVKMHGTQRVKKRLAAMTLWKIRQIICDYNNVLFLASVFKVVLVALTSIF